MTGWAWRGMAAAAAAISALSAPLNGLAATATYSLPTPTNLSASSCSGSNAEVEQAVDTRLGYVYEDWMGCSKIAFARSTDGGLHFSDPITLPGSIGSNFNAWDPAVAVGPDGTVYAAFMVAHGSQYLPRVAKSTDHGVTFGQVSDVTPPDPKNWGDRDFIAVAPDGTVYVTWDYGPERTSITYICASNGSCAFATGDLNVVMQKSTDGGKTWGAQTYISPFFPGSGGDSAPLVVEPKGKIDVLYQGYQITDRQTYTMNPAYSYFTSSTDGGVTWSTPVAVGPEAGTMSLSEWWIDGDIARDSAGNLYAVWDTQGTNPDGTANDTGWLSVSTNGGRTWSPAIQATDTANVPHIMEVAGAGSGIAYVSWLSSSDPRGYALYLRAFSPTAGWLSAPDQVSTDFGDTSVWPGDTTGISTLDPTHVVLSWGSATVATNKKSDIFAAPAIVTLTR